jgi:hypothetical protein
VVSPRGSRQRIDNELVWYSVVIVPGERAAHEVLTVAYEAAGGGAATVLDAAIVGTDRHGATTMAEAPPSIGRSVPQPSHRGLLSEHDLETIASAMAPDTLGVVIVVEHTWARPIAEAARRLGGYVGGGERIPHERLDAILPGMDPNGDVS